MHSPWTTSCVLLVRSNFPFPSTRRASYRPASGQSTFVSRNEHLETYLQLWMEILCANRESFVACVVVLFTIYRVTNEPPSMYLPHANALNAALSMWFTLYFHVKCTEPWRSAGVLEGGLSVKTDLGGAGWWREKHWITKNRGRLHSGGLRTIGEYDLDTPPTPAANESTDLFIGGRLPDDMKETFEVLSS